MFDKTIDVIKKKKALDKSVKQRRKNEMIALKANSAFKSRIYEELKHIEIMLEDDNIEAIQITVPDKFMAQFSTALYSEDLAEYDITQDVESNKFLIRRKFISI